MKKLFAILLSVIILICGSISPAFAKDVYGVSSIEDAYAEFKSQHGSFVQSFINIGISEDTLKAFLTDVNSYILEINAHTPITLSNFESNALNAIVAVSSREKYYPVQDALLILYPDAIKQALKDGTVCKDLQPVVDTVKKIVFSDDGFSVIGGGDSGSNSGFVPQGPEITFSDVSDSHWAFGAINTLVANLILNGYLDGTFKPDANITRAEFAKIIVSATNTLDSTAKSSFTDVSEKDWYYLYVASAYKQNFITGYPDGSFRPDDYITRADICTIVSRSIGSPTSLSGSTFNDDALIPSYAKIPVYALVKKGIINGMGDGNFAPKSYATRAQTAKIIYSAFFE